MTRPFHLAFPVHDLSVARDFYSGVLGCAEGRSTESWIDFNLYGHQIVAHQRAGLTRPEVDTNSVDGVDVPVPHFGVVLDMDQWTALAGRLKVANVTFIVEPQIRFQGLPAEQATLFFLDPSGNALEFKAFRSEENLFVA